MVIIREARINDIDDILEVEKLAWGENQWATKEMIKSRIETFPEGFLCVFENEDIAGFVCTEIIDEKLFDSTFSWYQITNNGFIKNTHNPKGSILYGVNLSISPYAERSVILPLFEAVGKLAIRKRLKQIVLGSRLPLYYLYDHLSVEEYINSKGKSGELIDPEIRFYMKMGLRIKKILPNYFEDPKSKNYGVLMVWQNPFYPFTCFSPLLAWIVSKIARMKI